MYSEQDPILESLLEIKKYVESTSATPDGMDEGVHEQFLLHLSELTDAARFMKKKV